MESFRFLIHSGDVTASKSIIYQSHYIIYHFVKLLLCSFRATFIIRQDNFCRCSNVIFKTVKPDKFSNIKIQISYFFSSYISKPFQNSRYILYHKQYVKISCYFKLKRCTSIIMYHLGLDC